MTLNPRRQITAAKQPLIDVSLKWETAASSYRLAIWFNFFWGGNIVMSSRVILLVLLATQVLLIIGYKLLKFEQLYYPSLILGIATIGYAFLYSATRVAGGKSFEESQHSICVCLARNAISVSVI